MAARTRFAFVFWMAVAVAVTILGNQTVDGRAGRSESIGCADCGAGNDLPATTLERILRFGQPNAASLPQKPPHRP